LEPPFAPPLVGEGPSEQLIEPLRQKQLATAGQVPLPEQVSPGSGFALQLAVLAVPDVVPPEPDPVPPEPAPPDFPSEPQAAATPKMTSKSKPLASVRMRVPVLTSKTQN
jgi:hypothetical protein